jgi:hypothetical protein
MQKSACAALMNGSPNSRTPLGTAAELVMDPDLLPESWADLLLERHDWRALEIPSVFKVVVHEWLQSEEIHPVAANAAITAEGPDIAYERNINPGFVHPVNWLASSGQELPLPIGGGFARVFRVGKLPVNVSLTSYYNVVRPDFGLTWLFQSELTFLF